MVIVIWFVPLTTIMNISYLGLNMLLHFPFFPWLFFKQVKKAHDGDLHCVDWNPHDINFILTGYQPPLYLNERELQFIRPSPDFFQVFLVLRFRS